MTGGIKVTLTEFDLPAGRDNGPFDPTKHWVNGPDNWTFKYSNVKKYWPIFASN